MFITGSWVITEPENITIAAPVGHTDTNTQTHSHEGKQVCRGEERHLEQKETFTVADRI